MCCFVAFDGILDGSVLVIGGISYISQISQRDINARRNARCTSGEAHSREIESLMQVHAAVCELLMGKFGVTK